VGVVGTGSGTFANKNVGNGKAVTVTGYTLGGADAGNYTVVQPTSVRANITPASLVVTGVGANNKVYDTTTTATLNGAASVAALGGDTDSGVGLPLRRQAQTRDARNETGRILAAFLRRDVLLGLEIGGEVAENRLDFLVQRHGLHQLLGARVRCQGAIEPRTFLVGGMGRAGKCGRQHEGINQCQ
jgi:hypothetical protein